MSIVKTQLQIEKMRAAGKITKDCLLMLESMIKPGITTQQIDEAAEKFILDAGATPSFKGHGGFPASVCTSVNDNLVHCIPNNKPLKEGDIISIDVGAKLDGFHSDAARTWAVGKIDDASQKLINVTKECFFEAIKPLKSGARLSLIGDRIENHAHKNGFSVVRDLCGHGIGTDLHEDPRVLNYKNTSAFILEEGMTIAVEPMINAGGYEVVFNKKTMEVRTKDGKRCAHYENTILITKTGVEILTE